MQNILYRVKIIVLLSILVFLPLARMGWDTWAQTAAHFIIAFLLLLETADILYGKKYVSVLNQLHALLICLLFVFSIIVYYFSLNQFISKGPILNFVFYFLIFYFIGYTVKAKDIKKIIQSIIAATACLCIFILASKLTSFPLDFSINPNVYAGLIVIVFPFFLNGLYYKELGVTGWILLGLFCLALIIARSVLGITSVFIETVVYYSLLKKSFKFKASHLRFAAIVCIILLFAAIFYKLKDPQVLNRFKWWAIAIKIIKSNFITGVGPGCYKFAVLKYKIIGLGSEYAHSYILELAAEWGVIWAGLYLCFIISIFKKVKSKGFYAPLFYSFIIGICLNSFFEYNLLIPAHSMFFFAVLGIIMNISQESTEHDSKNQVNTITSRYGSGAVIAVVIVLFLGTSILHFFSEKAYVQGKYYESQGNIKKAAERYNKAILLDKKNKSAEIAFKL